MEKLRDYYEVLGLKKAASSDEIKKAYRRLALEFHPDRHQDVMKHQAEEKFKEITAAYEILGDPEKRKLYDRHGPSLRETRKNEQANINVDEAFRNFDDIFGRGT